MRVLDLYCGAGGASKGLVDHGFKVVGVDICDQPQYPYEFHKADAMTYDLSDFDFIWASPVCKRYSVATIASGTAENWPDQIALLRDKLKKWGGSWAIENVVGAPLIDPVILCGAMFGLKTYRHRLIETSFGMCQPPHHEHTAKVAKMGRPIKDGEFISVVGNFSNVKFARLAMGIDWMTRDRLSQAIPPAFSGYVARQYLACRHSR